MAIMPSSVADEQQPRKKQPLSSVFYLFLILSSSRLAASSHSYCHIFLVFLQLPPYLRDGVSQNEADPADFARKHFLRRRTALVSSAAQEAVSAQNINLQQKHTGGKSVLLSKRKVHPRVPYKAPVCATTPRQMPVGRACEGHFSAAFYSPLVATGHGIIFVSQKGRIRRKRRNVAAIVLRRCLPASSLAISIAPSCVAPSSSGHISCLYASFVFQVRSDFSLFTVLPQNLSCFPVCCCMLVLEFWTEKYRRMRMPVTMPVDTIVYSTNTYSEQMRSDGGESVCRLASAACVSIGLPRIIAIRLLPSSGYFPTIKGVVLVLLSHTTAPRWWQLGATTARFYAIAGCPRSRPPVFSSSFISGTAAAPGPRRSRILFLQLVSLQTNLDFKEVQRMSPTPPPPTISPTTTVVVSPSSGRRTTVSGCVFSSTPIRCSSCSFAAVDPPSDRSLRRSRRNRKQSLRCRVPGVPCRALGLRQSRYKAACCCDDEYDGGAEPLSFSVFLSFPPASIVLLPPPYTAWFFRLRELSICPGAVYLSTGFPSPLALMWCSLYRTLKGVAYALKAPFSRTTTMFQSVFLSAFSDTRRKLHRMCEEQHVFVSFRHLVVVRRRQARGKRSGNVNVDVSIPSPSDIFVVIDFPRRVRVLRCMTFSSLIIFASLNCLGHIQAVSFFFLLPHFLCCLLVIVVCQSVRFILIPFLHCLGNNKAGRALSSPRQQLQQCFKVFSEQGLQQRRYLSGHEWWWWLWRPNISKQKNTLSTSTSSPRDYPNGSGFVFTKEKLLSAVSGERPREDTDGHATERQICRERLQYRAATGKYNCCYRGDDTSFFFEEEGEEKEGGGEERDQMIRYCTAVSNCFQEKKREFSTFHQFYWSAAVIIYAPFIVFHSEDGSRTRCCALACCLLVLWATSTHSTLRIDLLLLQIGSYFVFIWSLGSLWRLELLKSSFVSSRMSWPDVLLRAAAPSLFPQVLSLLLWPRRIHLTEFYFVPLPSTYSSTITTTTTTTTVTSYIFFLGSLLYRRRIPRRGCTYDPSQMHIIHTRFPSFVSSTLINDSSSFSSFSFSSSRQFVSFPCWTLLLLLQQQLGVDITSRPSAYPCRSAARSCSSCLLFCVVLCSVFAYSKGGRISLVFFHPFVFCLSTSAPAFPHCCRFCLILLGHNTAIAVLFFFKAEPAAAVFLFFLAVVAMTFLRPAGACSHSQSQRCRISPAVPAHATFDRMLVATATATAADVVAPAGAAACLSRFSGEYHHVASLTTRDAVSAAALVSDTIGALAAAAAVVVAGSREAAEVEKTGLTALFPASLLVEVPTAEHAGASRWFCWRWPSTISTAQQRKCLPTLRMDARQYFPLAFGWIRSAVINTTLLLYAVCFSRFALCHCRMRRRRPWTTCCASFSRSSVFLCPQSWASLLPPSSRPRCCISCLSPLAILSTLLLLLSWIASSSEFTVTSDVDQNIFLDLSGGLPEPQDSLLVHLSSGRRFSILNFDKKMYELGPPSYRSEAYQILFESEDDKENRTNPLACDVSLPPVCYSAYFIFASPLADFWSALSSRDTAMAGSRGGAGGAPLSPAGTSSPDIYQFSWPRGYQAVSLGTGLCIQIKEKQQNSKRILNVMFMASSAVSFSRRTSSYAMLHVMLWSTVSVAVALLPAL